jgi:hypothetical protein
MEALAVRIPIITVVVAAVVVQTVEAPPLEL